jgi:pyroglutamyl-peptidase
VKIRSILVTGFEPFGGDRVNPSQQVALALEGRAFGGHTVVSATLPCAFDASRSELIHLLRAHQPGLVICLGLAGGRAAITPERVAINIIDARIPDNRGAQPVDVPVNRSGPAAYWSRLPIKAIVAALAAEGIPGAVSATAGTYVCNHIFYVLMHALRWQRSVRGGFIHLPYATETAPAEAPSLPLEMMIAGIAKGIEVSLTTRRDTKAVGGSIH